MKQKLIIAFSVLLLLTAVAFMVFDFLNTGSEAYQNPYEYDMDALREVDENLLCYEETLSFPVGMKTPHSLAVDANDRIWVGGKDQLTVFDASGKQQNTFNQPGIINCLALGEDGDIYLGMHDHVEVLGPEGRLIGIWETLNEKVLFTGIALMGDEVFVADAGNKVVYRFDRDGILLNRIGEKDTAAGVPGFIIPSPYFDLAVGREGQLWVVNPGRHALEAYNSEGNIVSTWSRTSMQPEGFSGCCNPAHIAMLPDGSFVTSEKGIERVKIHLPSGDFKCMVAPPKAFEEGTVGLDLAVDSKGRILVLDPKKGLLRIFEEKK